MVDDNRMAIDLCKILFELDGLYTVETRYDGIDAVQWMNDHTPDLVILNYLMQHMHGDAVLRWMRAEERLAHIPVIGNGSCPVDCHKYSTRLRISSAV
jgi:CheY-like chemotaxis protein